MAMKITKTRLWVIGAVVLLVLIALNAGEDRPASEAGGQCLVKVTADHAPVRSGPNSSDPAVDTFPAGVVIQADRVANNAFRRVTDNRWVAQRHLGSVLGSDCG